MEEEKIKRKPTKLHNFDYGTTGAYFITICTQDRQKILSEIVTATNRSVDLTLVGDGVFDVLYGYK